MFDELFKKIGDNTFTVLRYIAFIFCFWAVSIFMFKPVLLQQPIYVQFFITFCFSSVWLVLYLIIGLFSDITLRYAHDDVKTEAYVLISIISKCVFIILGYHYSLTFIEYLKLSFGYSFISIPILCVLAFISKILRNKKQTKSE